MVFTKTLDQHRALSLGFQELGNQAFSFRDCPFYHSRENSFSDFSIFHFLILVCVSKLTNFISRFSAWLASIYGSKPRNLCVLNGLAKYYVAKPSPAHLSFAGLRIALLLLSPDTHPPVKIYFDHNNSSLRWLCLSSKNPQILNCVDFLLEWWMVLSFPN